MPITDLISDERVACCQAATSNQRMLEQYAQRLMQNNVPIMIDEVSVSLVDRKWLNSHTGLDHGVAIPLRCVIRARCNNQDLYELLRLWKPDHSNA